MKKLLLTILALSLFGCSKQVPAESPKENALVLNDEQTEQLDKLIYSGGFFDDVVESKDDVFYIIDNDTINVQLDGSNQIDIVFNVDDIATYTYNFNPIKLDYIEKDDNKSASMNSTYTHTKDNANSKITSTLVTEDNQTFEIFFNQATYKIENSDAKNNLPEPLNTKLFDIYVNQWKEFSLFDTYMQTMNKQITDLVLNFDSYTYRNKDYYKFMDSGFDTPENEIVAPTTTYAFTDFPYSANNHNYLYWYSFNGEPKKSIEEATALEQTLFLFFYLTSRDNFSIDELSSAFLTVKSQYYCYEGFCSTNKYNVNKGSFREHEFSLMTLDYFNQCINDVFGINPYLSLDKYEYLNSGVYVSQTEQTLMSDFFSGTWNQHYRGAVVDHYNEAGIDYVTFTPYIAQYGDCKSGQECTYDLYTTKTNIVKGNIPESKVNEYVVNNLSKFYTWELTLTPGSNPDFYQVLSYEQK